MSEIKQYEQYGIHYLGVVPWIMNNLHEPWIDRSVDRLCHQTYRQGAKRLHSFLWNGSLKRSEEYIRYAIPWKYYRGKVDFEAYNPEWRKALQLLDRHAANWNLDIPLTLFMARYNEDIFKAEHNVQGITGFYTPEALKVQRKFARYALMCIRNNRYNGSLIRSKDYQSHVLLMNEPICRGKHEYGANVIAPWHLKIWRAIEPLTTMKKLWVSDSECDYAHAELVERDTDPWTGKVMGNNKYDRKLISEMHGATTVETLQEAGFHKVANSAWDQFAGSEDGGHAGSFKVPGLEKYFQGNLHETIAMLKYAIRECNYKRKRFYFVSFTMSCLKQNKRTGFVEEYFKTLRHINFRRMKAYAHVARKLNPI